jgi:hypothetical protein
MNQVSFGRLAAKGSMPLALTATACSTTCGATCHTLDGFNQLTFVEQPHPRVGLLESDEKWEL